MKSKLLLITCLLIYTFQLISQESTIDYRTKFSAGVKGGLNFSNVFDNKGDEFNADPKFGLVLGGFISIPIDQLFGLQTELLFSQKGFKGRGKFDGKNYDMTRITTFLDIPFMVTVKPISMLTLMAGPQLSILASQRDVFVKDNNIVGIQNAFGITQYRRALFGLVAGADINVEHFVIGLRLGFDAVQSAGPGNASIPRYRNVWYQGTLGYRF